MLISEAEDIHEGFFKNNLLSGFGTQNFIGQYYYEGQHFQGMHQGRGLVRVNVGMDDEQEDFGMFDQHLKDGYFIRKEKQKKFLVKFSKGVQMFIQEIY